MELYKLSDAEVSNPLLLFLLVIVGAALLVLMLSSARKGRVMVRIGAQHFHYLPLCFVFSTIFFAALYFSFSDGDLPYYLYFYGMITNAIFAFFLAIFLSQDEWKRAYLSFFGSLVFMVVSFLPIVFVAEAAPSDVSDLFAWIIIATGSVSFTSIVQFLYFTFLDGSMPQRSESTSQSSNADADAPTSSEQSATRPSKEEEVKALEKRGIRLIEYKPLDD